MNIIIKTKLLRKCHYVCLNFTFPIAINPVSNISNIPKVMKIPPNASNPIPISKNIFNYNDKKKLNSFSIFYFELQLGTLEVFRSNVPPLNGNAVVRF